jgi:hypothetical protein
MKGKKPNHAPPREMPHKGISAGLAGAHRPDHTMGDMNRGFNKEGSPAEEAMESPAFERTEDGNV